MTLPSGPELEEAGGEVGGGAGGAHVLHQQGRVAQPDLNTSSELRLKALGFSSGYQYIIISS